MNFRKAQLLTLSFCIFKSGDNFFPDDVFFKFCNGSNDLDYLFSIGTIISSFLYKLSPFFHENSAGTIGEFITHCNLRIKFSSCIAKHKGLKYGYFLLN